MESFDACHLNEKQQRFYINQKIMKSIILTIVCFLGTSAGAFVQTNYGDIIGTFVDKETKEGIVMASVVTTRGEAVYRGMTDEDGRFRISAIPPGKYKVFFVYDKDTTYAPVEVDVLPDGIASTGEVANSGTTLEEVVIESQIYHLSKGVNPEIKLTKKDIQHLPTKFNAKDMVASMTTDVQKTADGELVFRGARKGDFITYIDGVKMTEIQNVPSASLGYVMVYSGAIPAKYGDTTGGIVIMETLSYFDLLREWENSQK